MKKLLFMVTLLPHFGRESAAQNKGFCLEYKPENKDGCGINPFKQPHYMLLNRGLGGMNGADVTNTSFPRRFKVDNACVPVKSTIE
jgi:hypothetical protein